MHELQGRRAAAAYLDRNRATRAHNTDHEGGRVSTTRILDDVEREILVVLSNNPAGLTMADLCTRIEATLGRLTMPAIAIDQLVQRGLVRKDNAPSTDVIYCATRAGRATVRTAANQDAGNATDDIRTMNDIAPGASEAPEGDETPATAVGASERTRTADPFITSVPGVRRAESVADEIRAGAGTTSTAADGGSTPQPSADETRGRSSDDETARLRADVDRWREAYNDSRDELATARRTADVATRSTLHLRAGIGLALDELSSPARPPAIAIAVAAQTLNNAVAGRPLAAVATEVPR